MYINLIRIPIKKLRKSLLHVRYPIRSSFDFPVKVLNEIRIKIPRKFENNRGYGAIQWCQYVMLFSRARAKLNIDKIPL